MDEQKTVLAYASQYAQKYYFNDELGRLPEEVKKAYMETIPLRRFGTAEDIAKCVAWLASDESSYVTGQIISVNGGMIG